MKSLKQYGINKNQMKGGEKMMKTIFRLFMVALLCLAFAGPVSAEIRNSKHDFSRTSGANSITYSTDETRMCIFCHTPHNAVENVPLWNRTMGDELTFAMYTASATLTSAVKSSAIDTTNISFKCLSCHDGTVSIGGGVQQGNLNTTQTNGTSQSLGTADTAVGRGGDLTDDHPIGFDFNSVGMAQDLNIKSLADAKAAGMKFYNAPGRSNQMECASCHDVHGQAAPGTKFLRTANNESKLCLSCHIK
jgi:predicted CXXCH cytochrome family protein